MAPDTLISWAGSTADALREAMARLSPAQWQNPVVTAQGRTVPATELPWLRAREVCVHSVDLATGVTFADLPSGFTEALIDEIRLSPACSSCPRDRALRSPRGSLGDHIPSSSTRPNSTPGSEPGSVADRLSAE